MLLNQYSIVFLGKEIVYYIIIKKYMILFIRIICSLYDFNSIYNENNYITFFIEPFIFYLIHFLIVSKTNMIFHVMKLANHPLYIS